LLANPVLNNKRKRTSRKFEVQKEEPNCNDPRDCEKESFAKDPDALEKRVHKKLKQHTSITDDSSMDSSEDSSDDSSEDLTDYLLSEDLYSDNEVKNGRPTRLRALVESGLIKVGASVKCHHKENPMEGIVTSDFKIRVLDEININLTRFAKSKVALFAPHIFFDGKALVDIRKEYDLQA